MKSARTLRRTFFISLAAALLLAGPVFAGGLYITEFGDPSQGASGAGAGALGQDASTAFHNPAGIMMLDSNENHWMASAIYVDPSMKFSKESGTTVPPLAPGEGNGGDAGVSAVGGGFWWARPINDKFGFGFALYSLSAAAMDYKSGNTNANDFVGRYWSTEVDLLTVNLMPSVAWRINDQWSVGFAVPIQVGQLDLTVAVPTVGPPHFPATDGVAQISNGDDVSATVSLSVLWEATDRLRFGAAYMGENELSFSSDLSVTGPGAGNPLPLPINSADVTIPFVQTVRVWGSSDLGDRLTVLASVAWEDWSSFDNLLISTDAGTGALVRDWKDTWKFGLGLRWRTAGAWTHYTGIAYDSSPTSASKRTADMPMDEQWRFSIGTNYAFNNGVKLGGVITYADYGEARIDNGGDWGTVVGKYSTNRIWFLGANIGW